MLDVVIFLFCVRLTLLVGWDGTNLLGAVLLSVLWTIEGAYVALLNTM